MQAMDYCEHCRRMVFPQLHAPQRCGVCARVMRPGQQEPLVETDLQWVMRVFGNFRHR